MKIILRFGEQVVEYESTDFIDQKEYESSDEDVLAKREEARINRIVWGKKIYLPKVILEGTYTKGE